MSGLIGLIYIKRRSIGREKDDHQKEEEVTGRVPEEGLESIQPRHGESHIKRGLMNFSSATSILDGYLSMYISSIVVWDRRPPSFRASYKNVLTFNFEKKISENILLIQIFGVSV